MTPGRGVCIDASALADLLVENRRGQVVADVLDGVDFVFAPDLVNVEVLKIIRRLERVGEISERTAAKAVAALELSPVERVSTSAMIPAVWQLRHNVTPQDACYVITARAHDVPLVTADLRLARAPKLGIRVIAV